MSLVRLSENPYYSGLATIFQTARGRATSLVAMNDVILPDLAAMTQALRLALPHFTHVGWTASTASTNANLLDMARYSDLPRPWLQGTHLQTQGRGRAGRAWQNQAGACLMFSCAFDVSLVPAQLPMLSPLSGMAACQALRTCLQPEHRPDLNAKWPNDVQWRGAKLAGILVETTRARASPSPEHHVVILGIGINLREAPALSLALGRNVADWSQIAQVDAKAAATDAVQRVASIAWHWQTGIQHLQTQGPDDFAQRYAEVDALAGQAVNILNQGAVVLSGIARGVNAQGQLLVRTDGRDVAVTVGEVSVRPS